MQALVTSILVALPPSPLDPFSLAISLLFISVLLKREIWHVTLHNLSCRAYSFPQAFFF